MGNSDTGTTATSAGAVLICLVCLLTAMPAQGAMRDFDLDTFDRIYMRGDASILLEQSHAAAATATGPTDRLSRLRVEVVDNVLYIDAGDSSDVNELHIHIAVDRVREIVSQGGSIVTAEALTTRELTLEGRGTGRFDISRLSLDDLSVIGMGATQFTLAGQTRHQMVDLSGVGRYAAAELSSTNSQVNVRGAGRVEVLAREMLDVNILGNASVRYSGAPWVVQQIVGAGSVARF